MQTRSASEMVLSEQSPEIGSDAAVASRASWRMRLLARLRSSTALDLLLIAALAALFFAFRVAYITADAPRDLPNGSSGYEVFAEPFAKAHEARNRALFGVWQTNPVDNYQYWRLQAPCWVYPLWLWFKVFGVSITSLRLFSSVVATLGFVVLLAFARRRLSRLGTAVAGVFLATNYYDILYQRCGLIETMVGAWFAVVVYTLHRALKDARWLLVTEAALVLGFLSKQTMVEIGPLFLIVGVIAYVGWLRRSDAPKWQKALPPVVGLVLLGGLALYVKSPAYTRLLSRNYRHMVHDRTGAQSEEMELEASDLWGRATTWQLWDEGYFSLMPVLSILALIQIARFVIGVVRHRRVYDPWLALTIGWLLTAAIPFMMAQSELRFRMHLFAPTALLAASLVMDLSSWIAQRIAQATNAGPSKLIAARCVGPVFAVSALSASLWFDLGWYKSWIEARTYTVHQANQQIAANIGNRRAVVIGSWAPAFVFNTRYEFFYVRSEFNSNRKALEQLGITHVLLMNRRDYTGTILRRVMPNIMTKLQRRTSLRYDGRSVTLYSVTDPPLR